MRLYTEFHKPVTSPSILTRVVCGYAASPPKDRKRILFAKKVSWIFRRQKRADNGEKYTLWSSQFVSLHEHFGKIRSKVICARRVLNIGWWKKKIYIYIYAQLLTPTHAQLQRHRLKFIKKKHLNTPTCFGLRPSSGSYNILAKVTII